MATPSHLFGLWGALALGALLLPSACKSAPETRPTDALGRTAPSPVEATSEEETRVDEAAVGADEVVRRFDLNKDKKPDVFKYYRLVQRDEQQVEVLTRKETDINFDGHIDMWRTYDETGTQVTEERLDLDFDGKIDVILHFKQGVIVQKDVVLAFSDQPTLWKYYEKGKLVRKERDTDGDGRVDYWEYWEGDKIDRIGIDTNADGRVDVWKRAQAGG